jgi:anti-sigma factor RsiW
MNEKTLERLLRADDVDTGGPAGRCPEESILAAYADGLLPEPDRAELESHLADCESCQGQIAFLASLPESPAATVPADAVARARALVPDPPAGWRPLVLRWAPAAACLACIAIVVVSVRGPGTALHAPASSPRSVTSPSAESPMPEASSLNPEAQRRPSTAPGATLSEPRPQSGVESKGRTLEAGGRIPEASVRRSAPVVSQPSVIFPADAATIAPRDLEVRWRPVPASRYYEISIVTDEGSVVWQGRLEGTSTRLPAGTRLDAGAKYFVWVKAFLAGGESVKSATVSFHVAGQ